MTPYLVMGNWTLIFRSLLGNALKYTDHGWVRVSLEADDAGQTDGNTDAPNANAGKPTTVRLTVTDTGRGISQDYLRTRLFTPFAQVSSSSSWYRRAAHK